MIAMLGWLIIVVGVIVSAVFSIQILIMNFQENVLWGLASLFFGLPSLIFVIMRWDKAGGPFLKSLAASFGSMILGGILIFAGS